MCPDISVFRRPLLLYGIGALPSQHRIRRMRQFHLFGVLTDIECDRHGVEFELTSSIVLRRTLVRRGGTFRSLSFLAVQIRWSGP